MSRPRKPRSVGVNPPSRCFRPQGRSRSGIESIDLSMEELEVLRLVDGEGLYQEEASKRMGVSRQTIQTILHEARNKVASALASGSTIHIVDEFSTGHCQCRRHRQGGKVNE